MKTFILCILLAVCTYPGAAQTKKALFDYTKAETAGNADWIIDTDMPVPSPAQSGITQSTPESYWLGAISAWGVDLVKKGFTVHTLTSTYGITYGNASNPYDLSNYNIFIVCEPQGPFSTAEKTAIKNFVQNGGGLMMVADHNASDRNSDGWDSPMVWNDLRSDTLFGIHFQSTGETNNNFTQTSTNVQTGGADPIINGAAGTVTAVAYNAGTSMTLLPARNASAAGHIWMIGASHGNSQVLMATARYGSGKVAGVGDSSPADDGTGQPGNTLYNGWTDPTATDNIMFINACLWLAAPDYPAAVTLLSPADLATTVLMPVTFTWNKVSGATAYQLDCSTSSSFAGTVFSDSTITDSTDQVSGLTPTTTYYWRVRAKNGAGWGPYSGTRSFTTSTAVTYTITSSAGPNGTISPSGTIVFNSGSSQTYTAIPATGYHVDSLLVDGVTQGQVPSYSFTSISASHTIRAVFAINTYTITATAGANGSISPSGAITVNWGAGISFTLSPTTGYHVDSLIVDGSPVTPSMSYTFTNVTASHTIRAVFTPDLFTITVTTSAHGAVIPPGPITVPYGASQSFIFVPEPAYGVDSVFADGTAADSLTGYTFINVQTGHTLRVVFGQRRYMLTIAASGGGSVTPSPNLAVYDSGSIVHLTAIPDVHHHFLGWSGSVSGLQNPVDITMNTNASVTGNFAIDSFAVNTSAVGGNILKQPDLPAYPYGSSVLVVPVPDSGSVFIAWSGMIPPGHEADSIAHLTVDTTKSVTATFSATGYTLTTSTSHGTIVRSPNQAGFESGSIVILTAVPDTGYHFDGWSGDTTGIVNPLTIIMGRTVAIRAGFLPNTCIIEAGAGEHGAITPSGSVVITAGNSVRFSFLPDAGYKVDSVVVDGANTPDSVTGYTFTGVVAPHSIRVSFTIIPVTVTAQLPRGWNMVSLPVVPSDTRSAVLFPGAVSRSFTYAGQYVVKDTLEPGKGYWIKAGSDTQAEIIGLGLDGDTIPLTAGWNMIGSVSHPVPVSSIGAEPPSLETGYYFGYSGRYYRADTILPAHGYWVRAVGPGLLILPPTGTVIFSKTSIRPGEEFEIPPPPPGSEGLSQAVIPTDYRMGPVYPNPFNPSVTISYQLPVESRISIRILNLLGQTVTLLADGRRPAGSGGEVWHPADIAGGVYFYRLEATAIRDPSRMYTASGRLIYIK